MIFVGNEPFNVRINKEIAGTGFAFRQAKSGFAVTSTAFGKLNLVDIDVNIGAAIANNGINSTLNSTTLYDDFNQRIIGITYGNGIICRTKFVGNR